GAPATRLLRPALRSRVHRVPQDRAHRAEPAERGASAAADPARHCTQRSVRRQARSTAATLAGRRGAGEMSTGAPCRKRASQLLRLAVAGVALVVVAACAPLPPRNPIATWVPSKNYDIRKPQLIVLHFTDQDSVQQALDTLRTRNPDGPVSAHDGHVYQLVSDADRAWHAGPGRWGTITDVNSASIGIEIDNNGHVPFLPAQIDSLIRLLTDL